MIERLRELRQVYAAGGFRHATNSDIVTLIDLMISMEDRDEAPAQPTAVHEADTGPTEPGPR